MTWQSTFSNRRYGLGQRILGRDGTIEYVAGANDMVSGKSDEQIRYYPESVNRPKDHVAARKLLDARAPLTHAHAADERYDLHAHAVRVHANGSTRPSDDRAREQ